MQTWQIMIGLNVISVLLCLVSILWFHFRKDDGEFESYVSDFKELKDYGTRKEGESK